MKKLVFILCFFFSFQASAQDNIDSLLDEILFEDESLFDLLENQTKKKYNFLYANSSYDGQSTFAGRDLGLEQFNITSQLIYFNSTGFSARLYGIWYSEFEPQYNVTGLSFAYSFNLDNKKKWRFRAGYDRYFFADNGEGNNNLSNSVSTSLTYKLNKRIKSSISTSFLLGDGIIPQLTWSTYGNFYLYKKDYTRSITFNPGVSVFMTSESFVTQFEQFSRGQGIITVEEEQRSFGPMSTRISLPITLNLKNWDFEVGFNYIIPSSPLGFNDDLNSTSYFSFSIGKLIDL